MRVSVISIVGNLLLTVFKLIAGILACSYGMISDAVHSASDIFSTVIVMFGIKAANKKADGKHPYGHERFECVAAVILAVVLLGTGLVIGYGAVINMINGAYPVFNRMGMLAITAALLSIGVKETMYWYTRHVALKINSSALRADAWHHRSDALSSVGSLVGLVGAKFGMPVLDSVAGIIICLFIVIAAVSIFCEAIRKMTDEACGEQVNQMIVELISDFPDVTKIDSLKTRKFGDRIYVDLEICIRSTLSFAQAHTVAEAIHHGIEKNIAGTKHCSVHFSPDGEADHRILPKDD